MGHFNIRKGNTRNWRTSKCPSECSWIDNWEKQNHSLDWSSKRWDFQFRGRNAHLHFVEALPSRVTPHFNLLHSFTRCHPTHLPMVVSMSWCCPLPVSIIATSLFPCRDPTNNPTMAVVLECTSLILTRLSSLRIRRTAPNKDYRIILSLDAIGNVW